MGPTILTDEQAAIQETARRFAKEKLKPHYQSREREEKIDRKLMLEMGGLGLIGADLPEEYGGLGASGVTAGMIAEEIAYGDFSVSYVQLIASLMGSILVRHAPPAIAKQWVPRMVRGETIVALGLTEPRGGSDAGNLALKAARSGKEYVLNGEKTSMSFSIEADAAVVFARTGAPDSGARGITAFFVPMDLPGISRTRFNDMGTKMVARGSAFFDNVRIPEEYRIGGEGEGFVKIMQGFDYSRILIPLQCLGCAQASVDETWEYMQERQAFGAPIAQYQGVSFPIAEAETMLEACRQLAYHGLLLRDHGKPHTKEAAMIKWLGPKTTVDVVHQCLLTFGHYGYTMDYPHQQRLRDVIGLEIGDGTAQIMKLIIARETVGRIAVQYAKEAK